MKRVSNLKLCGVFLAFAMMTGASGAAFGTVYVTGSVSASTSNVPLQTYESQAGSGSLAIDLGSYIRLGVTHKQEFQMSSGYQDTSTDEGSTTTVPNYIEVYSRTHIISNSLDLTLILYEGQIFLPYLTLGAVVKNYRFDTQQEGQASEIRKGSVGPVPNVGGGIGFRLNKDFTLKFAFTASPGLAQKPGEEKATATWDRNTSVGLTYQL
jgi:hypothetical protein